MNPNGTGDASDSADTAAAQLIPAEAAGDGRGTSDGESAHDLAGEATSNSGTGGGEVARKRLAAELSGVDLTPESTQDDIDPPGLPAADTLLQELPPHHLPRN